MTMLFCCCFVLIKHGVVFRFFEMVILRSGCRTWVLKVSLKLLTCSGLQFSKPVNEQTSNVFVKSNLESYTSVVKICTRVQESRKLHQGFMYESSECTNLLLVSHVHSLQAAGSRELGWGLGGGRRVDGNKTNRFEPGWSAWKKCQCEMKKKCKLYTLWVMLCHVLLIHSRHCRRFYLPHSLCRQGTKSRRNRGCWRRVSLIHFYTHDHFCIHDHSCHRFGIHNHFCC